MSLQFRNNTNSILILDELGLTFSPNGTHVIENLIFSTLNITLKKIANLEITVIANGIELSSAHGLRFLATGSHSKLNQQGRTLVQSSTRPVDLNNCWYGRADDPAVVNDRGNGERMVLQHVSGGPAMTTVYFDFNVLENITYLKEGYYIWRGALVGDYASFEAVTSKVNYVSSTNTNYNLYGGYLIVPAAGDGTIELTTDITQINPANGSFVQAHIDQMGKKTPAFWNADYNSETHLFENIQAAPLADGNYNLFAIEYTLTTVLNQVPFLNFGQQKIMSEDATNLSFGTRLKMTIETTDVDHSWELAAFLAMHRTTSSRT